MVIKFKPPKNILLTATLHIPRGREDMKGVEFMEENGGREGERERGSCWFYYSHIPYPVLNTDPLLLRND